MQAFAAGQEMQLTVAMAAQSLSICDTISCLSVATVDLLCQGINSKAEYVQAIVSTESV